MVIFWQLEADKTTLHSQIFQINSGRCVLHPQNFRFLRYSFICDDFNEKFWNLQDRWMLPRGKYVFFQNFSSLPFPRKTFYAGKPSFWDFQNCGTRRLVTPRKRNPRSNSPIDRSYWEEHLEFLSAFFVHTILRKRRFLFGKTWFWHFKSCATRDLGSPRKRNVM